MVYAATADDIHYLKVCYMTESFVFLSHAGDKGTPVGMVYLDQALSKAARKNAKRAERKAVQRRESQEETFTTDEPDSVVGSVPESEVGQALSGEELCSSRSRTCSPGV